MVFSIFVFLLLFLPKQVFALYDPLSVPNNRFGIHVADTNDIRDTTTLVNSSGGDWGYVTMVLPENDRNLGKWQEIFNLMRRLHLIPIIRIATHIDNANWSIPQEVDADKWADFLNSLNWPIENRYIVLFNEPNHAKEWGGIIDPEGYVKIGSAYAKAMKNKSADFFILPAGLDPSAATNGQTLDAAAYWQRMAGANPDFFKTIDGWTSHSYPNPGFSASPFGTGKGTLASFVWELQFMKSLGVTKQLPVFITETGWVHAEGKLFVPGKATSDQVGTYYKQAASSLWTHNQIAAVTPFVFSYQDIPFDHFSFKKLQSTEYYSQFDAYQSITKIQGIPDQHETFSLLQPLIPKTLVTNSTYTLTTTLKNTGQSIINPADGYELVIRDNKNAYSTLSDPIPTLEPGQSGFIVTHIKTPATEGEYDVKVFLKHGDKEIPLETKTLTLIPPPTLTATASIGWKKNAGAKEVTALLYGENNTLLHKFQELRITNGNISITGMYNMIPGNTYRLVLLVPYYLPRQVTFTLEERMTHVRVKRLLPFDINRDGALTLKDLGTLFITKPHTVLSRFF